MVVGFHLDAERRRGDRLAAIALRVRVRAPARRGITFHHRGVVAVGRQHVLRRARLRVLDHLEQRLRLLFTVDNPVGVKNLVAAVLGVGLRKHVQFNVVRVAPQFGERILQIVNFVFRQRQTQTQVSVDQRLTSLTQ
ncbi:hypothetical protein SDC9_149190 [bioreactor metagenome]|uniref:Uncharacterized protein n=1 Tax=bioreactor metagenome TaxID=1076179 RepID=A0A645EJP3_9ZZZZ